MEGFSNCQKLKSQYICNHGAIFCLKVKVDIIINEFCNFRHVFFLKEILLRVGLWSEAGGIPERNSNHLTLCSYLHTYKLPLGPHVIMVLQTT